MSDDPRENEGEVSPQAAVSEVSPGVALKSAIPQGRRNDEWSVCLQHVAEGDRAAFARGFEHFAPLI